jgi:hypothetical protein
VYFVRPPWVAIAIALAVLILAVVSDAFLTSRIASAESVQGQLVDAATWYFGFLFAFPYLLWMMPYSLEPALTLHSTFFDYAGLEVDWRDIETVKIRRQAGMRMVFLTLRDRSAFLRVLPKYARANLNARFRWTGEAAIRIVAMRGIHIETLAALCEDLREQRNSVDTAEFKIPYRQPRYAAPVSWLALVFGIAPLMCYCTIRWHQVVSDIVHPTAALPMQIVAAFTVSVGLYALSYFVLVRIKARNSNFDPFSFMSSLLAFPLFRDPSDLT